MFRTAAILAILASAVAFSPMGRVAPSSSLKMSFESELGAQPPLGFWDPIGLLDDADQERFDRLRYDEIKHGRISMLAILGHLYTTAGNRFPGDLAPGLPFTEVKNGLAAFDNIPLGCSLQILAFIGFLENGFGLIQDDLEADCMTYLEANGYSPEKIESKKAIELNNGRAAQMGILALMVHEKLDNNPYIINDLLGSPVPFNQ